MKKQKKIISHRFLDRYTVLGAILLAVYGIIAIEVVFGIIIRVVTSRTDLLPAGSVFGALIVLAIHKRWFLFILIAWALVPVNMIRHPENYAVPTLATLSIALMAGFAEETAFRGLSLSYLMRQWKDEKKLLTALLFTSALFGLVHLGNLFSGANVVLTLLQLISTFAAGLFLGAVYLRSGNLWPSIVLHTLHDIVSLLDVSSISGGVMTGNLRLVDLLDLLLSVILGGIGLWLIRPAKRGEILAVWREKWQPLPDTKM